MKKSDLRITIMVNMIMWLARMNLLQRLEGLDMAKEIAHSLPNLQTTDMWK